jgi:predicted membrane-bound dolichyl-phosphate-mannose-protein mannosyltransferase
MKINNQVIVAIVTGVCLIGLIAILKNILLISSETLSSHVIIYIIVYIGFTTSYLAIDKTTKSFYNTPLFWSIIIVITTLAIIAVYAL